MHFTVHIALPGSITAGEPLHQAVSAAIQPFSEHTSEDGQWDWWVVGGRWGGYFVLKDHNSEIGYETEPHVGGYRQRPDDGRSRADAARIKDIQPESLTPSNSYIDAERQWQTIDRWVWDRETETGEWIETPDDVWNKQYLSWIQSLDPDMWLVNVDCHS